ncbi:hypothetical protein [Cellulomonas shaoxiangyii]|uniref:Uncharacterized protein n=1 Tax=Cellulomonas shaoxiangyii TaxID=2566013 RepID=A0A4P7SIW7_9CELL|nr:hypothetical protein [Cellulomonas shaoxiangyii]QCB93608.1 hypothetical protein E5225_08570 [Cellulomonas shaoxiangyii]TGY85688.1 hypothetical protein E5226_05265 [Cellulomonas shaoxiangyii]
MLWTVVWVVLVLATLVGAFLLGRRLWRSAVALGAELRRASETLDLLGERVEQLEEAARAAQVRVRPALGQDVEVLGSRVQELRAARRARSAGRQDRHRATVQDATRRWWG